MYGLLCSRFPDRSGSPGGLLAAPGGAWAVCSRLLAGCSRFLVAPGRAARGVLAASWRCPGSLRPGYVGHDSNHTYVFECQICTNRQKQPKLNKKTKNLVQLSVGSSLLGQCLLGPGVATWATALLLDSFRKP